MHLLWMILQSVYSDMFQHKKEENTTLKTNESKLDYIYKFQSLVHSAANTNMWIVYVKFLCVVDVMHETYYNTFKI
jgi:hypothetical protein